MKLTTVDEMRNIDKRTINEVGIPEVVLMENAAREIYDALAELVKGVANKRICIVAGTGNNGGDVFAVARHVANNGGVPKVFILGKSERMTASAGTNFNIICNMGIDVFFLNEESDWDKLLVVLKTADAVVDGLFGTGFHGALRPEAKRLITAVNKANLPVVAADVPSGVNADNGEVLDTAIKADITVTLGAPKWGMFFAPGSLYCGRLMSDGIGIPREILEDSRIRQEVLLKDSVKEALLPRPADAHKGSCGRVLVVAGSRGMTGAACLASSAALTIGAGIVTLACPASLNDIYEMKLTEIMTEPLKDGGTGMFGMNMLDKLLEISEKYDTVLVGPGLGRDEDTQNFVRELVTRLKKPVILDADGIYAFREQGELLTKCPFIPILTPHLGEMATLIGVTVAELKEEFLELCREAAKEYQAILVVKSETTIVVYPTGMVYVTSTGNPGMATAGCGDVLAGTIAGLCKQTAQDTSALVGVYLHGSAGDFAYGEKGSCLLASDVLQHLPQAYKSLNS